MKRNKKGQFRGRPHLIWALVWLTLLGLLLTIAYIEDSRRPLISPAAQGSLQVPTVYANEIPKEKTKWFRVYNLVRFYESNYGAAGLAVTCAKKGLINEIGYLPVKGYCFNTRSDQELTFANWFNKRTTIEGMTIEGALCYWNTGKKVPTCPYAIANLADAN